MTLLLELTAVALLVPVAITPPGTLAWMHVQPPEAVAPAPVVAPTPVATPPVAVAEPVASSTTVVTPAPTPDTVPTTTVTTSTTDSAVPDRVVTTTTTTTSKVVPVVPAKVAVRDLLRYDPYLAPRYRSGRNMMIGGGVALGVGTATLLSTLSWMTVSHAEANDSSDADQRRRDAAERERWLPTARIVGVVAAAVAVTGVVLLATGGVRRRRAIEEARGRVYMQAGPGGMQVRF